MDKDTRNRIQRATQAARALLEHEYAEQLEGVFDIRLNGTIAAEPGGHLDAAQRVLRTKLVTAVEHQRASGMKRADAVAAYLREAAFTTLNRFVALKMLEARELAQECISRGDQSTGFKEFTGLASGLVQLPDYGYRLYVESLFDEIGREVRILFDRRDPASLLWPRRPALLDLLAILNEAELAPVWVEDETIGWVYQYFNGDNERKHMRAASQAPRNSRELAVRNQFFTPRYIVQFLADNTLGRIWYEMRQGKTTLRYLEYLVRKPNEVFLADGVDVSAGASQLHADLTPGEMLKRPAHVPFRAKKDPRDIRVLDPACGSGHFLLYVFDLLLTIYEEAWGDDAGPPSVHTGRSLRHDFPDHDDLLRAAPELILRYNIHGIDIDPRCTQIAALAQWMRVQRRFHDLGVSRDSRPRIKRINIVVAEAMPSLDAAGSGFVESLTPQLRKLVQEVFERLDLGGEAGSLLRIEKEMRSSVRRALGEYGSLFRSSDEDRWRAAEEELLAALQRFAEHGAGGPAYQRRLFAEDAARGFGFIDVCSQRHDVILMNPPFGEPSARGHKVLQGAYSDCRHDIDAAFVRRAEELCIEAGGAVGAIVNRTQFFKDVLADWRRSCLLGEWQVDSCADLGLGVLDGAMVEAAAYVVFNRAPSDGSFSAVRALDVLDKENALRRGVSALRRGTPDKRTFLVPHRAMEAMPSSRIAYWASPSIRRAMASCAPLDPDLASTRQGLITADNNRFLRLRWEVPVGEVEVDPVKTAIRSNAWIPYAKGGAYSPYFGDVHLIVQWGRDGAEIKSTVDENGRQASRPQNQNFYFAGGVTYTERTASGFSPRVLQRGCMFDCKGPIVAPHDGSDTMWLLGVLMSRPVAAMLELAVAAGDTSVAFGAARQYTQTIAGGVPIPVVAQSDKDLLSKHVARVWRERAKLDSARDTSAFYRGSVEPVGSSLVAQEQGRWRSLLHVLESSWEIEQVVCAAYGLDSDARAAIAEEFGGHPCSLPCRTLNEREVLELQMLWSLPVDGVVDAARETTGGARFVMKSQFFADKKLELVSHLLACHPRSILKACQAHDFADRLLQRTVARDRLFEFVGRCFRRWSADEVLSLDLDPEAAFPLPAEEAQVLDVLVDDEGHEKDFLSQQPEREQGVAGFLATAGSSADGVRRWIRDDLFSWTIDRYSKSRRKAPIYWQLSNASSSYSVWIYYHRLTRDTFYRVLSECAGPKLDHEERKLGVLERNTGPAPSATERKEVDSQRDFVEELRSFRDELSRVAPLWNPNLNDGVIINFAPLWRLVPQHRGWQRECKATWDKLCKGDYEWAYIAMHLWPERVVPKCAEDRSLAIAHGLEDVFWYQDSDGKWQPRKVAQAEVDKLIKERKSAAVKDALRSLLDAPAPATGRASRTKAARAKGSRKKTASTRPVAATNGASPPNRSPASVDAGLLSKVKEAIGANGDGASKTDAIDATGITASEWNKAIKALLADGSVTQTGERRGARYHLAGGDA